MRWREVLFVASCAIGMAAVAYYALGGDPRGVLAAGVIVAITLYFAPTR